ncbi:MAG: hypothetical protein ACR2LR_08350 [Hassallia sp.]
MRRSHPSEINAKAIAGGLIALLGVGMLIGQIFEKPQSTPALAVEIVPVKSN